jgi:hypothetical protein
MQTRVVQDTKQALVVFTGALDLIAQLFLDKRPSGPALLKKQGVLGLSVLQDSNESTTSQNEKSSRAAAWRLIPSNSL